MESLIKLLMTGGSIEVVPNPPLCKILIRYKRGNKKFYVDRLCGIEELEFELRRAILEATEHLDEN